MWRSPLFQQISIHALREEGDVQQGTVCVNLFRISIHALREEGDPEDFYCWYPTPISIHALREEGDPTSAPFERCRTNFYPRPPRGGRRLNISFRDALREFLSTPSARRATCCHRHRTGRRCISIHALREEGDGVDFFCPLVFHQFLSTPSARRATLTSHCSPRMTVYFYPRPPRGGRLSVFQPVAGIEKISIHALREEGDPAR